TGSTGLSKEEVEKMTKEAEMHAKEDAESKEKAEARNHADSLIFTAEKALRDDKDKVNEEIRQEVEEKVKALKDILDSGSKDDIQTKTQELSDAMQKIGQSMYKQQGEQQAAGETKTEEGGQTGDDKKGSDSAKASSDKSESVEGEVVE